MPPYLAGRSALVRALREELVGPVHGHLGAAESTSETIRIAARKTAWSAIAGSAFSWRPAETTARATSTLEGIDRGPLQMRAFGELGNSFGNGRFIDEQTYGGAGAVFGNYASLCETIQRQRGKAEILSHNVQRDELIRHLSRHVETHHHHAKASVIGRTAQRPPIGDGASVSTIETDHRRRV